jgi:hypothetical protein
MKRQPQIDEIVTFLEKKSSGTIHKLRSENPTFHEILKEGAILGSSDNIEELKVRAAVCFQATEETIVKCKAELSKIKDRLKSSQKIQLYGQIITTISGASVVTSLATDHKTITYIAGFLSLIGALVPLIVDFQKNTLNKTKRLDDTYEELVKMVVEAERNKQQLDFFIKSNFNVDGISEVINRCNQLCSDILERQLLS